MTDLIADGCKTKELGHFLKEAITLLKAGYHQNVIYLIGCVLIDSLEDLVSNIKLFLLLSNHLF